MAVDSSKESGADYVESLIDELIRDILNETGRSSGSAMRGMATTAALFETAFGSTRGPFRTSLLERILLAEAFAAELADALAPALAEQLAPRLMKAMEQASAGATTGKKPEPAGRSTGPGGKQEGR